MQNSVTMPSQPQLGTPVPGTTGGLPALSGLSVTQNPMAQQLQSMGRGDDTMLVHMTPNEVNSLQGLAMAAGGSLTINPMTGLPEASFLKKLLPTIIGIAGAAFGIPTWAIGLGVGAGQTALTGDLGKGITAGLQAFGGAGLGQAAGIGGKLGSVGADIGLTKSATGASKTLTNLVGNTGGAAPIGKAAEGTLQATFDKAFGAKAPGFLSKFGAEASLGQTGMLGKSLPVLAGTSVLGGISDATAPKLPTYDPNAEQKSTYVPMGPGKREVRFQTPEQIRESGGREFRYITPTNPEPVPLYEQPRRFAEGGATSAPPQGFEELVQYFGSTNPGAITAPNAYPSTAPAAPAAPAPTSRGEVIHDFGGRRSTAGNLGLTDTSALYGTFPNLSGLGALGGLDFDMAGYDAMIRRLRGDLGLGAPPPTSPVAPSAPSTSNMGSAGDAGASYGSSTQVLPEFTGGEVPYYNAEQLGPSYSPTPPANSAQPYTPSVFSPTQPYTPSVFSPAQPYTPSVAPAAPVSPVSPFAPEQNVLLPYTPDEAPAMPSMLDMTPVAPYVPPAMPPAMPEPMPITAPGVPPPPAIPAPAPILPTDVPRLMTDLPGGENYGGPYYVAAPSSPEVEEYSIFDETMFDRFARGGAVNMRDGSFVVDARTVSELGNGSSNAGIEMLSRMGGRPVHGPGDGVSDSVRASIGGKQEARVARDEVIFSPEAVRRVGGGSEARGTKKLYALMEKAHKARKKAKRGQDTGVRRGLA